MVYVPLHTKRPLRARACDTHRRVTGQKIIALILEVLIEVLIEAIRTAVLIEAIRGTQQ